MTNAIWNDDIFWLRARWWSRFENNSRRSVYSDPEVRLVQKLGDDKICLLGNEDIKDEGFDYIEPEFIQQLIPPEDK